MKRLLASTYYLAVAVLLLVLVVSAAFLWKGDWTEKASPELTPQNTELLYGQLARELDFDGELKAQTSRSSSERDFTLLHDSSKFASERTEMMLKMEGQANEGVGALLKKTSTTGNPNNPYNVLDCEIPPGGYKGWTQGTVSQLTPRISVNCSKVLAGEKDEVARVRKAVSNWTNAVSDQEMLDKLENCTWLRQEFTNNLYNTKLERNFSIAFTFIVYNSPQQVLRLLRFLYRPQNVYCLHYDIKSKYGSFFEGIARCFNNIMIASKRVSVVWGHYTILQAQMNCMSDLLRHRKTHAENRWEYVINLCGKELPLVTNHEMVVKLMKLKGTSSVIAESCAKKKVIIERRLRHPVYLTKNNTGLVLDLGKKLEKPPFDISLYHKSSSYNALSFKFVDYITFNEKARKVYNFLKKTKNAEEHFYATLYMTPGVPGGYDKGIPSRDYFEIAGSYWTKSNIFQRKQLHDCKGKVVHQVCIVGVGDLEEVVSERGSRLFHNKYFMEEDPVVMDCMEERVVALNRQEYTLECTQLEQYA